MKKFLLTIVLFLLPASVTQVWAYTEWSSYENPTTNGTTHTQFIDADRLYNANETDYTRAVLTSLSQARHTYGTHDLPDSIIPTAIMTRMTVKRESSSGIITLGMNWNWTDQSYSTDRIVNECWGDADIYASQTMPNDTDEHIYEFYISDSPTSTCVSDYFTSNGWDPADFVVIPDVSRGSTQQTVRIYDMDTRVTYAPTTETEIVSYVASESAQVVYADVYGTTAYAGEGVICEVDYFEDCVAEGQAAWRSDAPVVTIQLDPEYEGTTSAKLGGGVWQGIGYSETSSQWEAYQVEFPYHPGATCHYPTMTTCTENTYTCNEEDPPICYWEGSEIVLQSYSENDMFEIIHDGYYEDPEPSNPIQWIFWKFKNWFWDVFGFGQVTYSDFRNPGLEAEIATRAPFAYFDALGDLDFTPTATSTSLPVWTFNFPDHDPYTFTPPTALTSLFSTIRSSTKFVIWLLLLEYLFNLSKRTF